MKKVFGVILIFCFYWSPLVAQKLDWQSWTSAQFNYVANQQTTFSVKPIIRHYENLSELQNTSIDLFVSYKISKRWSANLLNRHFFIDGPDREFWFFDVNYKIPINESWTFSNKLRYHLAVNWNQNDADFVRYIPSLSYKIKKRIVPFVAADFFYRVSDKNILSGVRYKLGVNYSPPSDFKFSFQYWYQVKRSADYPIPEGNILVLNVAYSLKR